MKKSLIYLLMVCMVLSTFMMVSSPAKVSAAAQTTFYASPTGSDANPGSQSQPFQTIGQAQTAVRAINSNMTGDIFVVLMDGTYSLTSTLTFTSQDSGTNGYNVIYKADDGAKPVISGGKAITGWTLHDSDKNIYKAYVGTALDTRQFYVDGVRAVRAKGNGSTGLVKTATGYNLPASGTYANMASWGNVSNIEIVAVGYPWQQSRVGIQSISGSAVTMKTPGWTVAPMTTVSWVENAYELLDSSGEWYLDRSAGYMYYKPRAGEDMNTSSFIAASLETLVSGAGTLSAPVQNIQLQGLTFSYNTWLFPNGTMGYPDNQGGVIILTTTNPDAEGSKLLTPAGVSFIASQNVSVSGCTFTHMGNAGLSFGTGSQNNLIDHNTFTDLSGSGITIGNIQPSDHHPTDSRAIVKDNVVSNNTISNTGVEYLDTEAIFGGFTQNSLVKHNTMYNLPYTGISWGWGWGVLDTQGTPVAKNNTFSHNLIYDFMKVLDDGGGIYTLGYQAGSRVYNNYIHSNNKRYAFLYRDNGSAGFIDTNNVISSLNSHSAPWWYYTNTGSGGILNAHDNYSLYNYYSSERITNGTGGTNVVRDNYPVVGYAWDAKAQAIIANAGVDGGDGPAPSFALPIPRKIEAEFADLSGTASAQGIIAGTTGPSGSGYVNGFNNSTTAAATFQVVAPSTGVYRVKLAYSAGAGTSTKIGLYVNGTKLKNVTFNGTADWNTWSTQIENVTLNSGANSISYKAESSSASGIQLDSIDISEVSVDLIPGTLEAEFATLSGGATVNTNHTGYSGNGFVNGYASNTTATTTFSMRAPSAGSYNVKLYYSAGAGTSTNTGMYVNGVKVKNLKLTGTSNWDTWASSTEIVTLNAGINTIAYKTDTSSTTYIAVDKIDVTNNVNGSYSPPSGANLKLWLKADAGVTSDVNGKVSSWADQSGSASNAVQATSGNQPTVVASAINGAPAIRFDGIDDNLLASGVTGIKNTFTVMFVLKPKVVSNYNQSIGALGGWAEYIFHTSSTGNVYTGTNATTRISTAANTLVANTVNTMAFVFNNGAAKLYKNGTQVGSATSLPLGAAWTGFTMGVASANTLNGDLGEVIVYNTALSDADRQNLDAYLLGKWVTSNPAPTAISNVHIASSNGDSSVAVTGDTATLTFTTTEQVSKSDNFKINGNDPVTFSSVGSGNAWTNTATYVLDETDAMGVMTFQINVKNSAGYYSQTIEATSDGSSVTVKPALPIVDKAALNAKIAQAQALSSNSYTPASWTSLQTALLAAVSVNIDVNTTQGQVDAATTALQNAISGLQINQGAKLTGPASVIAGQSLSLTYSLSNVTASVYAQDFTVSFDPGQLQFVSAESLVPGSSVVGEAYGVGSIRLLTANSASNSTISGTMDVLKLNFQSKPMSQTVVSSVYLNNVVVADVYGDLTPLNSGSTYNVQLTVPAVDKTALNAAIAAAQALNSSSYTAASWSSLQTVLTAAVSVSNDANATQAQVNTAADNVQAAIAGLVLKANTTALNALIAEAQATVDAALVSPTRWGYYSQSAVNALNAAISSASSVVNDVNATQAHVSQAVTDLNTALVTFAGAVNTTASIGDLAVLASHYGATSSGQDWSTLHMYDFNQDNKLDIIDLAALARKILGQ